MLGLADLADFAPWVSDFSRQQPSSYAPVSDARSSPRVEINASRRPSTSNSITSSSASSTLPTTYPLPRLTEIYQGVHSDGSHNLQLSTNYPDVEEILKYARREWKLPKVKEPLLLALTATAVWDRPTDPVHWIFWGTDEKTKETKALIMSMLAIQPPIIHPMKRLSELDIWTIKLVYHGTGYMNLLKDEALYPWAPELVPRSGGEGRTLRSKRNKPARYTEDPLEGIELEPLKRKARVTRSMRTQPTSTTAPKFADIESSSKGQVFNEQSESASAESSVARTRRKAKLDLSEDLSPATAPAALPTLSPMGLERALSSDLSVLSDSTLAETPSRRMSRDSLESELTAVEEILENTKGKGKEKAQKVISDASVTPVSSRKRRRGQTSTKSANSESNPLGSSESSDLASEDEEPRRPSKRRLIGTAR